MVEQVEAVIVGAGVVGLAIARQLAQAGVESVLLEAEETFGSGTSARNSEVIHAGLYYPPGSLKARLCVAGRILLYKYCQDRGIDHARCGKILVACDAREQAQLDQIAQRAKANRVYTTPILSQVDLWGYEPDLQGVAGLFSPDTGIIDSHGLMLTLLGDAEQAGGTLVLRSPVLGGKITDTQGIHLFVGGIQPMVLRCRFLINAAGLSAPTLARNLEGLPATAQAPFFPIKGNYFTLSALSPFRHLIYPVPQAGGLGIHLTLDLAGRARFGPDTEVLVQNDLRSYDPDILDYSVNPERVAAFYTAIRRYWPALPEESLKPDYAGIRPRLTPPGTEVRDFRIDGPLDHGVPGLVNLFGIESPGLTACLAIAAYVAKLLP